MSNALKPYDVSTPEKRDEFIASYMPYAASIAKSVARQFKSQDDLDDLISCGYMGLLEASATFDVSKNVTFKYYAYIKIYGKMIDYLRKIYVGASTTVALKKKIDKLMSANKQLTGGKSLTSEELASELGISLEKLQKAQNKIENTFVVSFSDIENSQASIYENKSIDNMLFLASPKSTSEDDCILVDQLWDRMEKSFSSRELEIMKKIYIEDKSYPEISKPLGISDKRVSQLHLNCLKKLRKLVKSTSMPYTYKLPADKQPQYA